MLAKAAHIFDEGVVVRIAQIRFIISYSSSYVQAVVSALEGWRQYGNNPD